MPPILSARTGWLVSVVVVILASRSALVTAAPPTELRIVLADKDPELRRALETALAPWHLQVVLDDPKPTTIVQAKQRADFSNARFVVWRDRGQLVVFDREHQAIDRRSVRSGALEPVNAAAAALTVKTMMRLPPPPNPVAPVVVEAPPIVAPVVPEPAGISVRVQGGIAMRIAHGSQTDTGARFTLLGMIRPSPEVGWRFGVAGDVGASAGIDRAGFRGRASDWALLAIASWTQEHGTWELEPWLAGGMARTSVSGVDMMATQSEGATLATLRAGLVVRLRYGTWTLGGTVGLEATLGTPTYMKAGTGAAYYEPPSFAVAAGAVIAADLGR